MPSLVTQGEGSDQSAWGLALRAWGGNTFLEPVSIVTPKENVFFLPEFVFSFSKPELGH